MSVESTLISERVSIEHHDHIARVALERAEK